MNPVPPGQRTGPVADARRRDLLQGARSDGCRTDAAWRWRTAMSVADIKRIRCWRRRDSSYRQAGGAQRPADSDTFDLVGLLYNHLQQEIRDDAPAAALVKRMQLTLLRVALQDRSFFVRPDHPARQAAGQRCRRPRRNGWPTTTIDPATAGKPLQQAVTHAVKNYDGAKPRSLRTKQQTAPGAHRNAQVRRAETLERRHVEAARGKEKLEAAKLRAEQTYWPRRFSANSRLPKFTRALLNQAWADVLTPHLPAPWRGFGGVESADRRHSPDRWTPVTAIANRMSSTPALKAHVESALKQVGYHEDEADVDRAGVCRAACATTRTASHAPN